MEAVSKLEWVVADDDGVAACYDDAGAELMRRAMRLCAGDATRATDLVQDVFVKLLESSRAGAVDRVGMGWLVTSLRRRFLDTAKASARRRRRERVSAGRLTSDEAVAVDPGGEFPVLRGLSDRERAALVLRFVDQLSVAEVADVLGASRRATESLVQRAKRKASAIGEAL